MWETMYASNGVGLAAPQINKSIRLFIVDTVQIFDNMDEGRSLSMWMIRDKKQYLSMQILYR